MTGAGLRIAFAGTPELAAVVLRHILAAGSHTVTHVLTRPDRPAGRGRRLAVSPVKELALAADLPVQQPATASELDPAGQLRNLDLLLVVAYGMLLPVSILERPRLGAINVHLSLLPRWRGAAPIQRAIQHGDTETGVTIMKMDAGLDTGPVLLQRACPIGPDDTSGVLQDRLAHPGAELALHALDLMARGPLPATTQDPARVTHAAKITRSEARIDWRQPAVQLARNVRAFNPWPVCHTVVGATELRVLAAHAVADAGPGVAPGTVRAVAPGGIDVATGAGLLRITSLQLPGRRAGTALDFCNARHDWLHPGATAALP